MMKAIYVLIGMLAFSTGAMAQYGGELPPSPWEAMEESMIYCSVYNTQWTQPQYATCVCNMTHARAQEGYNIAAWYYNATPQQLYFYYQWTEYANNVAGLANQYWCQGA